MRSIASRAPWVAVSGVGLVLAACAVGCGSSVGDFNVAPPDGSDDGASDGSSGDGGGGDTNITDDTGVIGDDTGPSDDTGTNPNDTGASSDTGITNDTGTIGGDAGDSGIVAADSGASDTGIPLDSGVPVDGGDGGVVCPAPTAGTIFVAPTGSDTTGNGSQSCPYVTITKALSTTVTATGPTKIVLAAGTAASPVVYGNGCTAGAGSCDATPIRVTDGMNKGIVIEGAGTDPLSVDVVGGVAATDTAVFVVNAPNVGFQALTVSPKKIATVSASGRTVGAAGIRFAAPAVAAGGTEASVTNVVVAGIVHTSTTESTAAGIEIENGTSPTIGPAVNITGGDHAVLVTQAASGVPANASHPTITSSAAAPSFFRSAQFACVRIETTNAGATAVPTATLTATSTSDPGRLHLQDCGGNGGVVVDTAKTGTAVNITNTLIDTSVGGAVPSFYGIRLQHFGALIASNGVEITGIAVNTPAGGVASSAIEAGDNSVLGIASSPSLSTTGVLVTRNAGTGVHLLGNARADVSALTSTSNTNGLLCDTGNTGTGTNLVLRGSTLTGNRLFGLWIAKAPSGGGQCVADLGGNTAAGNNVYNTTATANGMLGICYQSSALASATSSTWDCGLASGTACQAAALPSPIPVASTGCDQKGDYNGNNVALTVALPQTCCGK